MDDWARLLEVDPPIVPSSSSKITAARPALICMIRSSQQLGSAFVASNTLLSHVTCTPTAARCCDAGGSANQFHGCTVRAIPCMLHTMRRMARRRPWTGAFGRTPVPQPGRQHHDLIAKRAPHEGFLKDLVGTSSAPQVQH